MSSRVASLLVAGLLALLLPATAHAGRLIETGHDADFQCARNGLQCNFIKAAIGYVRAGSPHPDKPVLVLDRRDNDLAAAIDQEFAPGTALPVAPQSATFASIPLSTNDWSAIAVASDSTCPGGGCDLNDGNLVPTDSGPIEARTADIAAFLAAGGGVFVGSGADNGDGHSGDDYYRFVDAPKGLELDNPTNCPVCTSFPTFSLTAAGSAIGFTNTEVNCCHPWNSFIEPPAASPLRIAETDSAGGFTTLFADTDAPRTTITSGPPGLGPATSATFAFRTSENLTTFQCSLDGGVFAPCAPPATFGGLTEGRHQLTVHRPRRQRRDQPAELLVDRRLRPRRRRLHPVQPAGRLQRQQREDPPRGTGDPRQQGRRGLRRHRGAVRPDPHRCAVLLPCPPLLQHGDDAEHRARPLVGGDQGHLPGRRLPVPQQVRQEAPPDGPPGSAVPRPPAASGGEDRDRRDQIRIGRQARALHDPGGQLAEVRRPLRSARRQAGQDLLALSRRLNPRGRDLSGARRKSRPGLKES
jgi:hypothetical protein